MTIPDHRLLHSKHLRQSLGKLGYQFDGNHELWFAWGGSAGHAGDGVLQVHTGTRKVGLNWGVTLRSLTEHEQWEQDRKDFAREGQKAELEAAVLEYITHHAGALKGAIRQDIAGRGVDIDAAVETLACQGKIYVCTKGGRGKRHYVGPDPDRSVPNNPSL